MPAPGSRFATATLVGVLVAAGVLRFWHLGGTGFGGDESVYAGQAAVLSGHSGFHDQFILVSRGNSNFLLFQWLLSLVYRVVGVSDIAARALAATFSTLTVLVTYLTGRELYGRRVGLLAAAFLAASAYSVGIGRLALLDAMLTLFVTLSMFCVARYERTGSPRWIYLFAAAAALAVQAKVAGGLVLVVFALYLVASRSIGRVGARTLSIGAGIFMLCLAPAFAQTLSDWDTWREFLTSSSHRTTAVSWSYYFERMADSDGLALSALWCVGIACACIRWSRRDLLAGLWALIVIGFFELYPLKAFNYLLPAIPALALLAGRAAEDLGIAIAGRRRALSRVAAPLLGVGAVIASTPALAGAVTADQFGGLREAARWLRTNAPANAGVMTISHGSAQYVFTFYAGVASYPFGRFNLATVLPGGKVIPASRPGPGDGTPRDWVALWPRRLITAGSVAYLVFYTKAMDDPPEESAYSDTSTQRVFRQLIARYGGRLVHTVYRNHEGQVWIYRLTKVAPITVARPTVGNHEVTVVHASGFARDAAVTATYHRRHVAIGRADSEGRVTLRFALPRATHPRYLLVVTDERGNYASAHLPKPTLKRTVRAGRVLLKGGGFAPGTPVRVTYHRHALGRGRAGAAGRLSLSLPLPRRRAPRWWLKATDAHGSYATAHLPPGGAP